MHNIDGNECLHYTTLNIHIILMECIREFKFGMMIHYSGANPGIIFRGGGGGGGSIRTKNVDKHMYISKKGGGAGP